MTQDEVVGIATQAMEVALKIALPLLLSGLIVGLIVSVFQAVTQIQEMTLSFIPKILVTAVVLVVAGPWMLSELVGWTQQLYLAIPEIVG